MLTIRHAATAHDLDLARARMQAAGDAIATAEWADLTDEQREMFLSLAIETKEIHEAAP
jgi:hypothetical protein